MIIIPRTSNYLELLDRHFYSPKIDGHDILVVRGASMLQEEVDAGHDDKRDIYTFGFDWHMDCSDLTNAIYKIFPNRKIWCVPRLEEPDLVQYNYKQMKLPHIDSCFNAEPFIRYSSDAARLYYNSVCNPGNFEGSEALLKEFGDFWKVGDSQYEQTRMRNVKDLVCGVKIKHVFDVGSYLGHLDDLLELNGVDVFRTDISSQIIKQDPRVNNLRDMSVEYIVASMQDCVMFASVLFAYSPFSYNEAGEADIRNVLEAIKRKVPEYIVYEDSMLNFENHKIASNKWIEFFSRLGYSIHGGQKYLTEAIENFHDRKNIRRHGSVSLILKHFGGSK